MRNEGSGNWEGALSGVLKSVKTFESESHLILAQHETSKRSRVISVSSTRKQLKGLSPTQEALISEALDCVEHGLFRVAIVSSWAALVDHLCDKIASDGLLKLKAAYPSWSQFSTIDEIRESISEYQIIEASRKINLINKAEMKSLHGHLSTRNQCAHPTTYTPGLNQALGYVSETLDVIGKLLTRML